MKQRNWSPLNINYSVIDYRDNIIEWLYTYLSKICLSEGTKLYKTEYGGKISDIGKEETIKFFKDLVQEDCVYNFITHSKDERIFFNVNNKTLLRIEWQTKKNNDSKINVWMATTNTEYITDVLAWGRENIALVSGKAIYTIGQDRTGFTLQDLGKINCDLIKDNYDPKIIDKTKYCIDQFNSETPNGRLTIINGQPGTGKTFLIKGMIPKFKNSLIVLLPSKLITEIDGPALASLFTEWKDMYGYDEDGEQYNPSIIFITEDADDCLTSRNEFNMSSVSSMLNNTDGIFGSLLDLRIIATTNAPQIKFDKAFIRPGRLCTHITVDKLTPEHASKIYERLTNKKKEYKESITLAEVYAEANNNPYGYVEEEKKVGFT